MRDIRWSPGFALVFSLALLAAPVPARRAPGSEGEGRFLAGAHAVDITPQKFPVIVNAMFEERSADRAVDPLHARCLALDDGDTRLVIVVVDSCMLPRDLIDETRALAVRATGIDVHHILISATHTHSAPSAMGCLGSRPDPEYRRFLPGRIVQGIEQAVKNLAPARVGWTVARDPQHTYCRRWIFRPDKVGLDPFGGRTVRANMHPGYQNPDAIGPSGPVDPDLSLLSVQSPEGRPIAVLANYSMHYFGSPLLSADHCGLFAEKLSRLVAAPGSGAAPPFVAILSQGTSGDQMWMDYGKPAKDLTLDTYAGALARVAFEAYRKIEHRSRAPLVMREARLTLRFRVPDAERLAWARGIAARLGDRLPRSHEEIYALEQIFLHERQSAELVLQAIRIGDLGIAAIPNEVFALSGLKIKARSPLAPTFTIELANGAEGYIPPPEQHGLGGYTTWPARTAGLEVGAEPRIVEAVLALLEEVSGKPRRTPAAPDGPYPRAILASRPLSYWPLSEMEGPTAFDASGHGHAAAYGSGIAFYLPGPGPEEPLEAMNRCPHFAGGRLQAGLPLAGSALSIELWFSNGLAADARPVTGYLLETRRAGGVAGERLGIGGVDGAAGRLFFETGPGTGGRLAGKSAIALGAWNHLVLARDGRRMAVFLNGSAEIAGEVEALPSGRDRIFIGGPGGEGSTFEGKIDEVAVYDRALTGEEAASHHRAMSPAGR